MARILSLRGTIGFFAAAAVAIVAIVTLSITLTTSLAALRSVGKLQASSLAQNAKDQATNRFKQGTDAVTNVLGMCNSHRWNYPSDDLAQFKTLQDISRTAFTHSQQSVDALNFWFYDNSQIWMLGHNATYYREYFVTASSFASTFPNSVLTPNIGVRRWNDSVPVTDSAVLTDIIHPADYPLFRVSDGSWQYQSLPMTQQGTVSVFGGIFPSVLEDGTIINSVAMIGPAYRLGDAHVGSNMFAIVSVTFEVASLNYFLAQLGGTANTVAVLYQQSTNLLASSLSSTTPFMTVQNVTATLPTGCDATTSFIGVSKMVCRANFSTYAYAPLNKLVAGHADRLISTTQYVDLLELGGDNYFVAIVPVPVAFPGMPLWIALTIPETDIIGDVVQGRNTAIGITCGIFVVVAVLNFVLVSLLLRPLGRIADRMIDASNLEDDGAEDEPSVMAEVHDLQMAYFEMNTELNRIRSFVPQTVLAAKRIEAAGMDLDLDFASTPTGQSEGDDTMSRSSRHSMAKSRRDNDSPTLRRGVAASSIGTMGVATHASLRVANGTVLICNLAGFHAAASHAPHDTIAQSMNDVVTAYGTAVTDRGGVFSFHGDRFFASFNAAVPCAAHARRAVEAALELQDVVPTIGLKLAMHCGVATGTFMVGSVGSTQVKTLSVMGHAVSQAAALETVGREFRCFVLATQRTVLDIAVHCDYRYVDLVPLQQREGTLRPTLVAEVSRRAGGSRKGMPGEAEWLYVVADGSAGASERNRVFEVLAQGDAAEARRLYDALPKTPDGDAAAPRDGLERAVSLSVPTP